MDEEIAYCGLVCRTCPIYLAAREEDKEKQARLREAIALVCNEKYGMMYGPEDITDCDGCRTGGRLFAGSRSCAIRKCAVDKGVINCAYCADYICGKLEGFFAADQEAKVRLDEVRKSII